MNPPEAFIQAALAAQPTPPVNNGIVFDQGGQAVMLPGDSLPFANVPLDPIDAAAASDTPQVSEATEASVTPSPTRPEPITAQATTDPQTPSTIATTATTATTATSATASVMSMITSQTTLPMSTDSSVQTTSDTPSSTSLELSSTTTNPGQTSSRSPTSSISTISQSSSTSSPSAASASSSEPSKPFTQSTPFIFLMVLGGLVLVVVAAMLCSTCVRWQSACGCLPCCRPDVDDEEDGLSDLIRTIDNTPSPSRATSIRSGVASNMIMSNSQHASLERRSTLLATSPHQSPFLHTANNVEGSVFGSTTAKMFPGGPLQVKNAVEGDIPADTDAATQVDIGPRHLGVEGAGLSVPWQSVEASRSFTAMSYASSRYGGPPFPSPPVTIDQQDQQPTRASTWASALRNTLFTAISANQAQGGPTGSMSRRTSASDEFRDRYTRSVLPLHRGSTRRSTRSNMTSRSAVATRSYPLVIDEKDEEELDAAQGVIGSRFLMNRNTLSHGSSVDTRMSGFERYKNWSRSQISADETVKPVLAGGERAKGARGGIL